VHPSAPPAARLACAPALPHTLASPGGLAAGRPDRPPAAASSSAAGTGYVSPSVVNDALDCLAAQANCGSFVPPASYPGIRGVVTRSINWDASNGHNFAGTAAPYLASLP
jgi:hypothetical protein